MVWRVLIVVLCCGSCADDGPRTGIAFLDRVELELDVMGLDHGRALLNSSTASSQCVTLDPSFGGSWGGVMMTVEDYGEAPMSPPGCIPPRLSVTIPDSPLASSVVEMHDQTATIRATFDPGMLDKRTMSLRSHTSWQFAPGDTVVIGWSRPEDLVNATGSAFFAVGPLPESNEPPVPHWTVEATTQADAIEFLVPQPTPASGAGTLLLNIFPPVPGITHAATCEGATECRLFMGRGVTHEATITP